MAERPVQITHHTSGNLFFPSISADGKTIVYEENFELWKLDTASGKSLKIPIAIKSDTKDNESVIRTFESEMERFSLSPSSRRLAVEIHGEIFTAAAERGEVQRVTESPWRDRFPVWSPDGKWIAFISDRSGREEVWIADELGRSLKQISNVDSDKSKAVWAPDSRSFLWAGSDFKLWRVELESGITEAITFSDVAAIQDYQYSPDGKWISYTKTDARLRAHVYLNQLGSADERKVEPAELIQSQNGKWTPDGKKFVFVGLPDVGVGTAPATALYTIALTGSGANPNDRDIDTEEQAQAAAARRPAAPPSETGGVEVNIDWSDRDRRLRMVSCPGNGAIGILLISPDGQRSWFNRVGNST